MNEKYVCTVCGYVYDEEAEGVKFADLPDDWECPTCGVPKAQFERMQWSLRPRWLLRRSAIKKD